MMNIMTRAFILNEVQVDQYGFTLTARTSSDVPEADRTGDHSTYEVELIPDEAFLGEPLSWTFSGEIERGVVISALRELADQLEKSKSK